MGGLLFFACQTKRIVHGIFHGQRTAIMVADQPLQTIRVNISAECLNTNVYFCFHVTIVTKKKKKND